MGKNEFMKEATGFLSSLYDTFSALPDAPLAGFEASRSVLIVVDMINGFVKEGKLSSPRVFQINDRVAVLAKECLNRAIPVLAFADSHGAQSPEFLSYPCHCIAGTRESELTDELKKLDGLHVIKKNSTNGYLEPEFRDYLDKHPEKDTFLVTGCCTDLCVQQFCLTLKTAFNREDRPCRIVVPADLTATFDLPAHNGGFCDISAYFNMSINGIEIVKNIETASAGKG